MGDSSSRSRIARATDFIDGRKLVKFSILPRRVQTVFEFELGATLRTIPYDRDSEQWLFFQPSQKVLTLRADGRYRLGRSDRSNDQDTWKLV
jgi:hypothetical protein